VSEFSSIPVIRRRYPDTEQRIATHSFFSAGWKDAEERMPCRSVMRALGYLYPMLLRGVAFPDFCEPCLPRFVFGMAVLATLLVAAPAAHAACRSPKNICKHFDDCLQRTSDPNNKDADGIRAGVKARNGQIVLAGAEACARDLGKKQQWDKWARGCSELEFVQIAKVGLELGKVHCDRYSQ
jgi:hypothetical protein